MIKFNYPHTDQLREMVIDKLYDITSKPNLSPHFIPGGICSFNNMSSPGRKLHEWEEFKDYLDFIQPYLKQFLDQLNIKAKFEAMWVNRYPPGTYVVKHDHRKLSGRDTTFIGVLFYIKKPPNGGNLFIENKEIDMWQGDVIIFESSKEHWTSPNNSSEDKFVIGMEFVKDNE
mgnify:FL=1